MAAVRWAPIAALVMGGIVLLSVLTGPSGLEPEDEAVEAPSITSQTTTTVPTPGSSRDLWTPPDGTWVGGFAFLAGRPDTLYGPSMAAGLIDIAGGIIVDSLPDGRLVAVREANQIQNVVLLGTAESDQTVEHTPLPELGPMSTPPLLSPNGTRLAVIDTAGVPYVWNVGTGSDPQIVPDLGLLSPRDSASTAVEAIASLTWSPDSTFLALNAFQGGYYVWDLKTNQVSRTSVPGRAIAISDTQVAAWGIDGLELRDLTGRVLRRWPDVVAGEARPLIAEGAFDPLKRYLAVRGRVGTDSDAREGLTVLSTIGTTRQLLTTDPAQGFAWSGNGSGLYWMDSHGLQAWSADPERASATLVGRGGEDAIWRLRVYDPAISPVLPPTLTTTALLERREGTMYHRTIDGLQGSVLGGLTTITPGGVSGLFLSVQQGEVEQPVILTSLFGSAWQQTLGTLNSFQLPDGAQLVRALALSPGSDEELTPSELEATRWYLETDSGSILFGPDSGLFTTAAEGTSLNILGGTAFHITPDHSAVQTIPVEAAFSTVLTAADLNAERVLAVGAVRRTLFVLVADTSGPPQLWQVPADSPLLTTPLFPPAPSITSEAWIVYTFPEPATGGWILTDPDTGPSGELLAARIDGPDGPLTVVMAAPLALESICGASAGGACVLAEVPGNPLGFSPDGNWLLIGNGDTYVAVSTVGRGIVAFPDTSPDDVAWVSSSS